MESTESKYLYVKTYGCQMNVYDSNSMEAILGKAGYVSDDNIEKANVIVLNTCNIREKAAEKVYSELGKINILKHNKKQQGDNLLVVVAGCVGQAEGEEIFRRAPVVDIVVGPQSYHNLPTMIKDAQKSKKKKIDLDFSVNDKFDYLKEEFKPQGISSFLTIQEGCDKFCKFCIVPYTRGAQYSRPSHEIFREAMQIVKQGSLEITLLGQNVSSYNAQGPNNINVGLGKLIELIATIPNLERIRYTTSHPRDMDDDLINIHGIEKKLMPFLHLPVQSGSDKILHHMNRKHTAEQYLKIIEKFRKARPDIAFSSDFIVGYPGETDEDFQSTLNLIKEVKYAQAYSFKYSERPGTPAAEAKNQVPEEIKQARLVKIQNLLNQQQNEFNDNFIGKKIKILLEKQGRYDNQLIGKSEYMQSVYVDVSNQEQKLDKIIEVIVKERNNNSLKAEIA